MQLLKQLFTTEVGRHRLHAVHAGVLCLAVHAQRRAASRPEAAL